MHRREGVDTRISDPRAKIHTARKAQQETIEARTEAQQAGQVGHREHGRTLQIKALAQCMMGELKKAIMRGPVHEESHISGTSLSRRTPSTRRLATMCPDHTQSFTPNTRAARDRVALREQTRVSFSPARTGATSSSSRRCRKKAICTKKMRRCGTRTLRISTSAKQDT